MILQIFSIYDRKAKAYTRPFYETNEMTASRSFAQALRDTESQFSKTPEDFRMDRLGEFDDSNGVISAYESPEPIMEANPATED